jgi:hypothetical protein
VIDTCVDNALGPAVMTLNSVHHYPSSKRYRSGSSALGRFLHCVTPAFPDDRLFVNQRGFNPEHPPLDPADMLSRFVCPGHACCMSWHPLVSGGIIEAAAQLAPTPSW